MFTSSCCLEISSSWRWVEKYRQPLKHYLKQSSGTSKIIAFQLKLYSWQESLLLLSLHWFRISNPNPKHQNISTTNLGWVKVPLFPMELATSKTMHILSTFSIQDKLPQLQAHLELSSRFVKMFTQGNHSNLILFCMWTILLLFFESGSFFALTAVEKFTNGYTKTFSPIYLIRKWTKSA